MTFAVIGHPGDRVAVEIAAAIERRLGPGSVTLAWAEELMLAVWRHRVGGSVTTEIVLRDGRALRSDALGGVFCRLTYAPTPLFTRSTERDRQYAAAEGYALLLSWLAGLPCPVVNRPGPLGLSGPQLTPVQWLALAGRCGLRTRRTRLAAHGDAWREPLGGPPHEVHVVGHRVLGAVSESIAGPCLQVARQAGCAVLGLHFAAARPAGEPVLCGVDTAPQLAGEGIESAAELVAA